MYEKQIEEVLAGKVISLDYDKDDMVLFFFEASGKFEEVNISAENDVEIWYDEKDNVILLGILKYILENQDELESASHLPCCGQLVENCNCQRYIVNPNYIPEGAEILDVEDDGEYSWQGQ